MAKDPVQTTCWRGALNYDLEYLRPERRCAVSASVGARARARVDAPVEVGAEMLRLTALLAGVVTQVRHHHVHQHRSRGRGSRRPRAATSDGDGAGHGAVIAASAVIRSCAFGASGCGEERAGVDRGAQGGARVQVRAPRGSRDLQTVARGPMRTPQRQDQDSSKFHGRKNREAKQNGCGFQLLVTILPLLLRGVDSPNQHPLLKNTPALPPRPRWAAGS